MYSMNALRPLYVFLSCVLVAAGAAHGQTTYYVNDDGVSMTCTGWGDACPDLQTALGLAVSGDQIWVAIGTYKPTSTTIRSFSFTLKEGVALYGGFDGPESTLGERAGLFDETILSGDIGTPDDNSDNSYHVVYGSLVSATAVLDGFTVTDGNADGASAPLYYGGGDVQPRREPDGHQLHGQRELGRRVRRRNVQLAWQHPDSEQLHIQQ